MFGKLLLTLDAIVMLVGPPLADYNHTHIFNPHWPPHAKFHCGQTITLSVTLGVATLFYTWRPSFLPPKTPAPVVARVAWDSLHTAAFTGSIYWLAGLAAIMYPGTDGTDPQFGPPGFPQGKFFAAVASLALLGCAYERHLC